MLYSPLRVVSTNRYKTELTCKFKKLTVGMARDEI